MSKYDEAIKYFEDAIQESDEIIADCTPALQAELTNQREHFVVALSALLLQINKTHSCSYCDDGFTFWQTEIGGSLPKVNYCPMCGRALREGEPVGGQM